MSDGERNEASTPTEASFPGPAGCSQSLRTSQTCFKARSWRCRIEWLRTKLLETEMASQLLEPRTTEVAEIEGSKSANVKTEIHTMSPGHVIHLRIHVIGCANYFGIALIRALSQDHLYKFGDYIDI